MFLTALKIYGLTNLLFLTEIAVYWFPEGVGIALFASLFSLIFTAPLIVIIGVVLWILNWSKFHVAACWILFLAAIAAMTILPFHWFGVEFRDGEMEPFTYCVYAAAFISILILRKTIHTHFATAQPDEKESDPGSLPEPVQPFQSNNLN
jgi:hypothetical protein